jgi:hypothetical protein
VELLCADAENQPGKRDYYLVSLDRRPLDINSTSRREVITENSHMEQLKLNQLSTNALFKLLDPFL